MEVSQYKIVTATKDELKNYEDIQKRLSWDPMKKSYLTLWEINPDGLFFGKLGGQIISCILALKYSKKFGFIAVYWVDKKFRGKGYGYPLFIKAMQFLYQCEIIALDSVEDQIKNYAKFGFQEYCLSVKRYVDITPKVDNLRSSLIISDLKQINMKKVAAFDQKYFPAQREKFIERSFQIGKPFVSLDKITKNVLGYTNVLPCETGFTVGPLIAQSEKIAQDLVKSVFAYYQQGKNGKTHTNRLNFFFLDQNFKIKQFAKKWFPKLQYNAHRMYCRTQNFVSDFDRSSVYGISGYERG